VKWAFFLQTLAKYGIMASTKLTTIFHVQNMGIVLVAQDMLLNHCAKGQLVKILSE